MNVRTRLKAMGEHLRTAGGALGHWMWAQFQDAVVVGVLWFLGLWALDVPLAQLWAFFGMLFQFVPHFGAVLSLLGPATTAAVTGGMPALIRVLILYAAITVVDGLLLQPLLMKHSARVPIWASILAPLVLGLLFSFWGVLLAPPLLAVLYAWREKRRLRNHPGAPDS